ncbi:translation initiation factor IF-2 N-terminal domain-containing protein [Amycolatopsis pithecellobii]|uniref:Ribonuclease E n=1 Tax=Amycolatopsis pithecellobii TaxID=664692 RepID=A0A6N7ZCV4_9PSEU|nr:Rne/Rng family ribonuclease [Amycolatopsis pithecellobii]MTD59525.1 Rne/Rng family ribonuclease [Amycolatopsis pithecellobii]
MTNAETPADNTGGDTAAPTSPLGELPERVRVHALAKLLGSNSRDVLAKLTELGEPVRSVQSSVPRAMAIKVAEALAAPADEPEPAADPQPAAAREPVAKPEVAVEREPIAKPQPAVEPAPAAKPDRTAKPVAERPGGAESAPAAKSAAVAEPAAAAPKQATPAPAAPESTSAGPAEPATTAAAAPAPATESAAPERARPSARMPVFAAPSPVFLPPEPQTVRPAPKQEEPAEEEPEAVEPDKDDEGDDPGGRRRRRRGRRGRGRGKGGDEGTGAEDESTDQAEEPQPQEKAEAETEDDESEEGEGGSRRRRRRRRRKTADDDAAEAATGDDPPNTVVHVRESKGEDKNGKEAKPDKGDGVRSVRGSTRLEAKRQRRRDGREAGRRRAPILSEAEFLARRESVERTMVVAERGEHTQIGVLEDGVLVEHFVTAAGSGSIVGNVYLGRVQNVLPSMEAAFVDIGRGRNAVLYAGEVDWDAAGLEGKSRKIEQALSTGDNVLVQVTKDPVGHKGARLTTQISLPGRFLVYVPAGGATGISRKLPENERRRLKDILKRIVPEDAGVIIRTASEGISEEELERDVRRLKAQWEVIKEKADSAAGGKKSSAPTMLYEEPDLLVKVVRDLFTEDFAKLEVQGGTAWETIDAYVGHVAPDLAGRLKRYVGTGDVFTDYRIDEQITKALDRKVWLPSGGYLVIDRTEAMTVIDVNTGKFTGSGGNLEETVTRNNLESAEEIVRQLRLRDIGGIIVIDFIDMVLESNRELVLRRLTECLGRDRTRHQVAEVTSLGLVQMTRKKVGTGLLEAYSTPCEHCKGRGVIVSTELPRPSNGGNGTGNGGGHQHGSRRARGRGKAEEPQETGRPPERRESVVSAVQAMANAAKLASGKPDGELVSDKPDEAAEQKALELASPQAGAETAARWAEFAANPKPDSEPAPETTAAATLGTAAPAATEPEAGADVAAAVSEADASNAADSAEAPSAPDAEFEPAPWRREPGHTSGSTTPQAPVEQSTTPAPERAGTSANPAEATSGTPGQAESAEPAPEPSVEVPTPAVRTAQRRPRRAASRPAGPPVHASDQS